MVDIKVNIIGSSKPGHILSKDEALLFSAHNAGVCYTEKPFAEIDKEDLEVTQNRRDQTLKSEHQSVYDHTTFNLELLGLPKILAMVLNNEKMYTTSEKSARYTRMQPTEEEQTLYLDWSKRFGQKIAEKYPKKIKPDRRIKLARENARYAISVFTPTNMTHSLSMRQLNYVMHWFNDFVDNADSTPFNNQLKISMQQFNDQLNSLYVDGLQPRAKFRKLSLFAEREDFQEVFNEVYSTNYEGSFAQLAQAHRHRTLNYQMQPITDIPTRFFVPPIIADDETLVENWLEDLASVAHLYPQGSLVQINERGLYEDFISKCGERLCGHAQLEISLQTDETLQRYITETRDTNPEVYEELMIFSNGPKCNVKDFNCRSPCLYGKKSLERLI
ncbi:MAG: FAD-dependent thymidylate synthase [Nanoarchaeota archaeon]|nr:FAD-dependent thymidylate synthase [Nanoarchaeota archaeon]